MSHKLYALNQDLLVLRNSNLKGFLDLSILMIFIGIWYWVLAQIDPDWQSKEGIWILWILYLVPLLSIGEVHRAFRVIVSGKIYEFDKGSREIRLNGKRLLDFDDVSQVQLKTIYRGPEWPERYNLSLVKLDKKKIRLNEADDEEQLTQWAYDIADYVGVGVTWKTGILSILTL